MKCGVQLYTLRDYMEEDFWGTLKKVADIGFKGVEFAGFYGQDIKEIKKFLDDCGMVCISNHLRVPTERTVDEVCEELSILGTTDWTANIYGMDTEEGFTDCFEKCQKGADLLKDRGFRLILHNHFWEHISKPFGKPFYEKMLEDIDNLYSELDLAWTLAGGYNPLERVKTYNHKIALLHTQDVKASYNEIWDDPNAVFTAQYSYKQTANGYGDAKVKECIAVSEASWAIVEINQYVGEMWNGVIKSYNYLTKECNCEGSK